MGQTCSRGGDVAESGKDGSLRRHKGKGQKKSERPNGGSDSSSQPSSPKNSQSRHTKTEEPVAEEPSPREFSVVTQIQALQHTMRPTVAVVSRGDLHREFRQFTPIFKKKYPVLSVVSCQDAKRPRQVLLAGEDRSIAQLNYETGHVMRRWVMAHSSAITSLTRPVDTGIFASGGRDSVVKMWNLNRDEPISVLQGHKGAITSVDVVYGATYVVSGGEDGCIRLWDVAHAMELFCPQDPRGSVTFVRSLPKLNLVAEGSIDSSILLWDVREPSDAPAMTLTTTVPDMEHAALCCDMSPLLESRLLTGHAGDAEGGSYVREWDLRQKACVCEYSGHKKSVTCLRMASSNLFGKASFFTASEDGSMGFWNMEPENSPVENATLPIDHQFQVPEGAVNSCECEQNGDIIVGLQNSTVVVFRPEVQGSSIMPAKRFRYVGVMDIEHPTEAAQSTGNNEENGEKDETIQGSTA